MKWTNLKPRELSETEQPSWTKAFRTYVVGVQLSLQCGSPNNWSLLPDCGICFPAGLPCLASVGEDAPNPAEIRWDKVGWYPGRTYLLRGEEEARLGRDWGVLRGGITCDIYTFQAQCDVIWETKRIPVNLDAEIVDYSWSAIIFQAFTMLP